MQSQNALKPEKCLIVGRTEGGCETGQSAYRMHVNGIHIEKVNVLKPLVKAGGTLTEMEGRFAELYCATYDRKYAAKEAGYSYPRVSADKLLKKRAVLDEIGRIQDVRMRSEVHPAAVNCLLEILQNPKAPAGARVSASKVAFDYLRDTGVDAIEKDPEEMTAEELAAEIAKFERVASARAQDVTPAANDRADPDGDIFG